MPGQHLPLAVFPTVHGENPNYANLALPFMKCKKQILNAIATEALVCAHGFQATYQVFDAKIAATRARLPK